MSISVLGLRIVGRVEHRGALGRVAEPVPCRDVTGRGVGFGLQLRDELARLVGDFDHFRMAGGKVSRRAAWRGRIGQFALALRKLAQDDGCRAQADTRR